MTAKPARQTLRDQQLADWVVTTCLLFGTTVVTAYTVAGMFIEALDNSAALAGRVEEK